MNERVDRNGRLPINLFHIKSNNRKQLGEMTVFVSPFLLSLPLSPRQTILSRFAVIYYAED